MAAHDPRCRMGAHLLLVLALGIPCLVVGCEGVIPNLPPPTRRRGRRFKSTCPITASR